MKLRDAIEGRRSVRRFSHRKPDWRKIIRAIDAVRFAPSAGNLFVTRFILVADEKKIAKLAEACQQEFVGTASYVVVAVSDDSGLVRDYGERGARYCAQQAGAAIENFLLALVEQNLVTSWVGHFYDEQVKRVLEIDEKLNVEAIFPIGVETAVGIRHSELGIGKRGKLKLDSVIYFDKWKNKKMAPEVIVGRKAV